jgi:hypothetical protein
VVNCQISTFKNDFERNLSITYICSGDNASMQNKKGTYYHSLSDKRSKANIIKDRLRFQIKLQFTDARYEKCIYIFQILKELH